jgi:O-antigen ligase/Flp pilus assembly protein TadD
MASSKRETHSAVGVNATGRLALFTLIAVVSFTPWLWNAATPWGVFGFRLAGLAALAAVSVAMAQGRLDGNVWSARAALLAIGVVLVAAFSAAGSVHRGKSLEAMLNLLAILGLFLAALLMVRGGRNARWLAIAQILCALPVAALGILQQLRPELVPAGNSYPGRALGPFLQPNRLGGYLIAALPLAIALTFLTQDRWLRLLFLVSAFLLMLCLVLTYSRGAWIAFGVAAVAFAWIGWQALAPRPLLAAAVLAVLVLPALALLPSMTARVAPRPPSGQAWNLPFDPEREGSAAMRSAVWEGSASAAMARPWLGWGPGAFREAFDRSKNGTMKRLEAEGGRTADQAHGYYLALLVERGVPGFALFALFAVTALLAGVATSGSGAPAEARLFAAGLVASAVALLAHAALEDNLVLAPHATALHANLALLVSGASGPRGAFRRMPAIGLAGALVALGAAGFAVQSARAETAALAAARSGSAAAAGEGYATAGSLAPWDDRYAIGEAKAAEARGEFLLAETAYRRAVDANGSDPVTKHELARLYLSHPDRFNDAVRKATALLQSALTQNPYYAEIRNDLGVARLRSGDRAGALQAFREAAEGRAAFVDPLVNAAAMALESGDRDEAVSWTRQALERNPGSARALAMASALGILGSD